MLHSMHVASACFKCFRCFIRMLQVFHLEVAKVDLDVAYVFAMNFKCFRVFLTYVVSVSAVSDVYCKCLNCFRRILQVFSYKCCKSKSKCRTYCSGTHLLQTPIALLGHCRGSPCGGLGLADASAGEAGNWDPRGFPACGNNSVVVSGNGVQLVGLILLDKASTVS
jgi:hypothetical protein